MRFGGLLLTGLACLAGPASAAPPPQPVTIVAHRGLTAGMPENTLAAFRGAAERGVPVIELDLRSTRDGHIVVMHDPTVDRTTKGSGRVADMTLASIKTLEVAKRGAQVPTFAEALQAMSGTGTRLLLDIKPGTPLDKVIGDVRRHHAEARVIFGLRHASDIARVRRELPTATALAFIPGAGDAPAHAAAGAQIIRLWSDWVVADPALVKRTKELGPSVWVMVGRRLPARKREWRSLHARLIELGADGIVTDRPDLVKAPK
jgi:glycerophosphoryl diester phosphodiesterase